MSAGRGGPMITLLSDLGIADTYVGVMKAVILTICPEARIVDLCHEIDPQDIEQAAFFLETAWPYCPPGTVHVVVVDPGVGSERRIVAVEAHDQQFVAPDNGVLTYVLAQVHEHRVFSVEDTRRFLPEVSQTFHGRDIMAPVAARLALGLPAESLGPELPGPYLRFPISRPVSAGSALVAHVIHVDRFGNLVTDLSEGDLRTWREEFGVEEVIIQVGDSAIEGIRSAYAETAPGELLAIFGSARRLEIALNLGSAARCLGLGRGAIVMIEGRG